MRAPVERETGRFNVLGSNGNQDVAIEYTNMIDATTLSDATERRIPGTRRYTLQNGSHLNTDDGKTFEEAATGKSYRRV